jgi:hypothetical protein
VNRLLSCRLLPVLSLENSLSLSACLPTLCGGEHGITFFLWVSAVGGSSSAGLLEAGRWRWRLPVSDLPSLCLIGSSKFFCVLAWEVTAGGGLFTTFREEAAAEEGAEEEGWGRRRCAIAIGASYRWRM